MNVYRLAPLPPPPLRFGAGTFPPTLAALAEGNQICWEAGYPASQPRFEADSLPQVEEGLLVECLEIALQ